MIINKALKKFSCILTVILLLLSTNTTTYASDLSAELKMNYQKKDDFVNVQIDISEKSNLGTLMFDVIYDSKSLEVVSSSPDDKIFSMTEVNDKENGQILFSAISVDGASSGGTLLNIKFKMIGDTSTVKLNIKEATLADDNFTDVLNQVKANSASSAIIEVEPVKTKEYSNIAEKSEDKVIAVQEEKQQEIDGLKEDDSTSQNDNSKEVDALQGEKNSSSEKGSIPNILIVCLLVGVFGAVIFVVFQKRRKLKK